MSYVVRRLQKMDLSFFHAHGANAPGHQRAINIDGWLVPYLAIPVPSTLTIRFRHPDSGRLTTETRPFGRLHKNYRIHGEMIRGGGFGGFGIGDIALLRFVGQSVTFGLFRNVGNEQALFKFLNSTTHVDYRRNMGLVGNPNRIRELEELR